VGAAPGIERKYFWRSQKIGAESPVFCGAKKAPKKRKTALSGNLKFPDSPALEKKFY
jgi:hypothetical protein